MLAPSAIMRSKLFKFIKLHLWLILALIISHQCIKTFDLMFALVTKKLFMQSKFAIDAFFSFDLMIVLLDTRTIMRSKVANNAYLSFDLMIEMSSSWSKLWNFIVSFDLMNKYNSDLMIVILISWNSTLWSFDLFNRLVMKREKIVQLFCEELNAV